ncbi:MAG: cobalt-precorrin-6A reductase [Paracoccaceae bacterium]
MSLLLLGGTAEARALARELARAGIEAVVSLAGVTRAPAVMDLPVRIGGFGGDAGFAAYLAAQGISGVIDATHPFAAVMSERAARICSARGVDYLRLERAAWEAGPGDLWHAVSGFGDLAGLIPKGARVFLATGRQSLPLLGDLAQGRHLFLRQIEPARGDVLSGVEIVLGRGPFSIEDEAALLRKLRVDWLVVKNAGGAGGRAKLEAARLLEMPVALIERPCVAMIARPAGGDGALVRDVGAALDWAVLRMRGRK